MPHKATRVASPLMTFGGNLGQEPASGPAGPCQQEKTARGAELVLVGGKIRTPAHPSGFVRAAAIGGGVIRALGSDDQIRELVGPYTRVVSLRCNLLGLRSRQDCLDAVAAYSKTLPRNAWVLGGGWSLSSFPGGTPTAADLDAVTGGRPAFLPNRDHHSAWVNTAALSVAGVTDRTPDPADGRIERDYAGFPTGALHDGAMRLVADYVPPPSAAELTAALLAAQEHLHSLGITSFQDACVGEAGELGMPDTFETYRRAAADRLLTCRVTGSLWWDRGRGLRQLDTL